MNQVLLQTTHGLTLVFGFEKPFSPPEKRQRIRQSVRIDERLTVSNYSSITFIDRNNEVRTLDLRADRPTEFSMPSAYVARVSMT